MKYKVLFTAPTAKGEASEVSFDHINQTIKKGNYSVTLWKIIHKPTIIDTGSAVVMKISEFGRVTFENCSIAKIK